MNIKKYLMAYLVWREYAGARDRFRKRIGAMTDRFRRVSHSMRFFAVVGLVVVAVMVTLAIWYGAVAGALSLSRQRQMSGRRVSDIGSRTTGMFQGHGNRVPISHT